MAYLSTTVLVLLVLQAAGSCRYFCKDHQTNTYQCCDLGNPNPTFNPGGDKHNPGGDGSNPDGDRTDPGENPTNPDADPTNPDADPTNPDADPTNPDADPTNPNTNPGVGNKTDPDGGVHKVLVTEHGTEDGAKYNASSSCRYYCAYGGSVYCCDDGSLTMPEDHDPHSGRCPTEHEQVCKEDAVFLSLKANKVGKTLSGTTSLSQIGDEVVRCASDGYCGADEKCCTSACHKRHVCLKSLHEDKGKQ